MPAQTAPPPSPAAAPAIDRLHALKFARNCTRSLLEGIPADKMCTIPPGCGKNAIWVMAHLAMTDDYVAKEFGKQKSRIPESWNAMFGMNTTPISDASKYPPAEQVRKIMDESHAAALEWFASLSDEELAKPMPKEWQPYAPTLGDLATFGAWHEGYHGGQLSAVRKGLGLPPAFG